MGSGAIRVEGLGKRYRLGPGQSGSYRSLREDLMQGVRRLFGPGRRSPRSTGEDFWALRDVSFEVRPGEVVGIIGRNGAGKSTLLKVLSRITDPTEGRVRIGGRVASLLEVGTGFHPELSGRENIFLNGAILGMSRKEIRRKFDEIAAFAEVEAFLDVPVKRYSSGMYVRLAFSVAAHLEPEILLVDEVLAVGDAEFRRRCLGKMRSVSETEGRTVLFVSHDMSAIQALCRRALLLQAGRVEHEGTAAECVAAYLSDTLHGGQRYEKPAAADGRPTLVLAEVHPFRQAGAVEIECAIETRNAQTVSLDLRLIDPSGYPAAFGSLGTFGGGDLVRLVPGRNRVVLRFPADRLAAGSYFVSLDVTIPDAEYFDRAEACLQFDVTRAPEGDRTRVLAQAWGYGAYELQVTRLDPAGPC